MSINIKKDEKEFLDYSLELFELSWLDFVGLTMEDFKKIYHKKMTENHPDNHPGEEKKYTEKVQIISYVYEFLCVYHGFNRGNIDDYVNEWNRNKEYWNPREENIDYSLLNKQQVLNQAILCTMENHGLDQAIYAVRMAILENDYESFSRFTKDNREYNYRVAVMKLSSMDMYTILENASINKEVPIEQKISDYVKKICRDIRIQILDDVCLATCEKYGESALETASWEYNNSDNANRFTRSSNDRPDDQNLRKRLMENIKHYDIIAVMKESLETKGIDTTNIEVVNVIHEYSKIIGYMTEERTR